MAADDQKQDAGGDVKKTVADEALAIVNGARRSAYGKPENNFQRIANLWNAFLLNRSSGFDRLSAGEVALMIDQMKTARLQESPDHRDSIVDKVGYSLCYAEIVLPQPSVAQQVYQREIWGQDRKLAELAGEATPLDRPFE